VLFRAAAQARGDFDYERRLGGADGDSRWIRLCGRALSDEAGQVVRCVGFMRDVTGLHTLRESEERLRFVVAATHDGVWELDVPTGRIWWSDDMLAMLGLARDRCPQDLDAALALVHPDDRQILRAALDDAATSRRPPRRQTVRMRHSGGGWRQIESWTVAETDPESGDATRIAAIVHDLTDAARRDDEDHELARALNNSVLEPIETAARHAKMAALALGASPGRAGDLIDVSSAHLGRARDAVEALIHSELSRRDAD
jgi:PAS domain S-box-containing protein